MPLQSLQPQSASLMESSHSVEERIGTLLVVVTVAVRQDVDRYEARAYAIDCAATRLPVSNGHGQPLIAFGNTPAKARGCLVSALRRRGAL